MKKIFIKIIKKIFFLNYELPKENFNTKRSDILEWEDSVLSARQGGLLLPTPGGNQKASKQRLHAHVKEQH